MPAGTPSITQELLTAVNRYLESDTNSSPPGAIALRALCQLYNQQTPDAVTSAWCIKTFLQILRKYPSINPHALEPANLGLISRLAQLINRNAAVNPQRLAETLYQLQTQETFTEELLRDTEADLLAGIVCALSAKNVEEALRELCMSHAEMPLAVRTLIETELKVEIHPLELLCRRAAGREGTPLTPEETRFLVKEKSVVLDYYHHRATFIPQFAFAELVEDLQPNAPMRTKILDVKRGARETRLNSGVLYELLGLIAKLWGHQPAEEQQKHRANLRAIFDADLAKKGKGSAFLHWIVTYLSLNPTQRPHLQLPTDPQDALILQMILGIYTRAELIQFSIIHGVCPTYYLFKEIKPLLDDAPFELYMGVAALVTVKLYVEALNFCLAIAENPNKSSAARAAAYFAASHIQLKREKGVTEEWDRYTYYREQIHYEAAYNYILALSHDPTNATILRFASKLWTAPAIDFNQYELESYLLGGLAKAFNEDKITETQFQPLVLALIRIMNLSERSTAYPRTGEGCGRIACQLTSAIGHVLAGQYVKAEKILNQLNGQAGTEKFGFAINYCLTQIAYQKLCQVVLSPNNEATLPTAAEHLAELHQGNALFTKLFAVCETFYSVHSPSAASASGNDFSELNTRKEIMLGYAAHLVRGGENQKAADFLLLALLPDSPLYFSSSRFARSPDLSHGVLLAAVKLYLSYEKSATESVKQRLQSDPGIRRMLWSTKDRLLGEFARSIDVPQKGSAASIVFLRSKGATAAQAKSFSKGENQDQDQDQDQNRNPDQSRCAIQ